MLIEPEEFRMLTGERIVLRSAAAGDAPALCLHRRITSGETHFMARYPEECPDANDAQARSILAAAEASPRDFHITAFAGRQIIGDLSVSQVNSLLKCRHRAGMGISIQQAYCGAGLGSAMLASAIRQARANGFEQLELGMYADNARAIRLYEKHGFQRFGVQPRAFRLKDGSYRDELIMVRFL